jgi:hypothetical protein
MTPAANTLDEGSAPAAVDAAIWALPPAPQVMEGRGIVIPGGGHTYFPGAWVCIRTLRDVGCSLPIELWHVGEAEVDDEMRRLVEPYGVTCVDAENIRKCYPARFLQGWPLKPYAMMHSRFREVLLLDADNMPLVNPDFLFDDPMYRRAGAVFWPDKGTIGPDRKIWRLMGVPFTNEPAVEAAQLLVDKSKCWRALALTVWMNCGHADFWYRHLYGDKDTFHLAWRRLGLVYAMPAYPMGSLPFTMIQYDFNGGPIFQHRHWNKWRLDGQMVRIPGFRHEARCLEHLEELRERWSKHAGRPYDATVADSETRRVAESLVEQRWLFRTGRESNELRFATDGRIVGGSARERNWSLRVHVHEAILSITGIDSLAWLLVRGDGDRWVGRAPIERDRLVELTRARSGGRLTKSGRQG